MKIKTDMLITLSHILDEFTDFRNDLKALVEKKNHNILFILSDLANEKYVLGNKDVKVFYQKYKKVIDTINKGSCSITLFLSFVVSDDTLYNFDFFYNYLIEHKNELAKVLGLLEKIKTLRIDTIKFMDKTFTDKVWELPSDTYDNVFVFMENMVVVPSYLKNTYKTTGTHFIMNLHSFFEYYTCCDFIVNSLTFDAKLLPNDLSKENTYDKIMEIINNDKNMQYRSDIDDILKLDLPLEEMIKNYKTLYENILNLKRVTGKEELKQVLVELNKSIHKLKKLQDEYNQSIIDDNPLVTKEVIEKEKTLYLQRLRSLEYDDFD